MRPEAEGFLRDQGRGVVGALLLGMPLLFTMELWWLAWTLPTWLLATSALAGLATIVLVVPVAGFRKREKSPSTPWEMSRQFTELVLQSVVAALGVFFLFGILDFGRPPIEWARAGLMALLPLGLGAAIANTALRADGRHGAQAAPFPRDVALFALGALFFTLPIAPTEEMELMASHAGWWHLAAVIVTSIGLTYLTLYELEFRGQGGRLAPTARLQVAQTFMVYVIGLAVAASLLAGYGHFDGEPVSVWVQSTVVLSLPAAMGGAAAQVVF